MSKALTTGFVLLLLTVNAWATDSNLEKASDEAMAERVAACAACHGERGHAGDETYAPSIAGKPQGYLHQQLLNFRDGRRQQREMALMMAYLSDDYLQEMAAYYAAQSPRIVPPQTALTPSAKTRGRQLVEQGDNSRDIPACQSCHGVQLLGVQPFIPGLLGLSSDYLAAQLGAWRAAVRQAVEPDCMATIAQRLSPQDIAAVTQWIASLPLPPQPKAEKSLSGTAPMDCGAVQ